MNHAQAKTVAAVILGATNNSTYPTGKRAVRSVRAVGGIVKLELFDGKESFITTVSDAPEAGALIWDILHATRPKYQRSHTD